MTIRTDHFHYYKTQTGEYWGSALVPPEDPALSYTHQVPPGRDPLTERLRWTGTDWQIEQV